MNAEENLTLMGLKISIDNLTLEIAKQRQEAESKSQYEKLPEWITLEQAAELKGGGSLTTYRQKAFLMPCCGKNWKLVSGRRCWKRSDVLEWLAVSDESLKKYAENFEARLPSLYEKRSSVATDEARHEMIVKNAREQRRQGVPKK
jgi:hypothetical protein